MEHNIIPFSLLPLFSPPIRRSPCSDSSTRHSPVANALQETSVDKISPLRRVSYTFYSCDYEHVFQLDVDSENFFVRHKPTREENIALYAASPEVIKVATSN